MIRKLFDEWRERRRLEKLAPQMYQALQEIERGFGEMRQGKNNARWFSSPEKATQHYFYWLRKTEEIAVKAARQAAGRAQQ